jgi:(1->4)-alpha-D-glucan 1-alpha-D-glucosylmutase
MNIPTATYRIQLHKEFPFDKLNDIIDYLETLGVSTIYAAPIVQATPGSMHGYDVTDPHKISNEIGTIDQLREISLRLKDRDMNWLQDIVPNHMAFHVRNFRLMDVMERGKYSPYYNYFDILWQHHVSHLDGKLQVPFLGEELDTCVNNNDLKIGFSENGVTVDYFKTSYPLSLDAYEYVFTGDKGTLSWNSIVEKGRLAAAYAEWKKIKDDFTWSVLQNEGALQFVLDTLDKVNKDKTRLKKLLNSQYYLLDFWKHSDKEMGYRRFFTVNELICLRMEDPKVFDEYHQLFQTLYKEGLIQGLRIDHIDGLQDPAEYLNQLRKCFGDDCYIVAEKILESKESMPDHWPLQGTSGYEFLSHTSQLFTNRSGAKELLTFYKELVPALEPYHDLVLQNKIKILETHMGGEWDNLVNYFFKLDLDDGFAIDRIKQALKFLMISLPVYRLYPERLPLAGHDLVILKQTFEKASVHGAGFKSELDHFRNLFTTSFDDGVKSESILQFLKRLMQFTGPLTAKGVEDTTFYIYNPLISHDEVGDAPSTLGISVSAFHSRMVERQKISSLSLNATATHDTKRGEDARLRLNVLCEFPDQWKELVKQWMRANNKFKKKTAGGQLAPVINDEYFIYQSIVGGFPEDFVVSAEWVERLKSYFIKVVREAKVNSTWGDPEQSYEDACVSFITSILAHGSEFLNTFLPFIKRVAEVASRYSVGQTLIKLTAPGIPDTYQGCELWDLSFVDPDNRRPVDYEKRKGFLVQLVQKEKEGEHILFPFVEDHKSKGIEKLFVTWKVLNLRKEKRDLFTQGSYIPLQIKGKDIITVAFARNYNNDWAILIAPLRLREKPVDPADVNSDDEVILPEGAPGLWRNTFTNETIQSEGSILLSACFTRFSVAMFTNY